MRFWLLCTVAACTSMPSSGRPFEPVTPTGSAPLAAAPVTPRGPQGDASAFEDDRTEGDADVPQSGPPSADDKLAQQARFLKDNPTPAPAPATAAVAPLPATPAPVWDPSRPLPEASFGVRVLGVLLDLNPPRAVLGLPDGREQVVTPGAMLPAEGVVVLAIGRDAVQIARITPQGFYARVETDTVAALSPTRLLSVPAGP